MFIEENNEEQRYIYESLGMYLWSRGVGEVRYDYIVNRTEALVFLISKGKVIVFHEIIGYNV